MAKLFHKYLSSLVLVLCLFRWETSTHAAINGNSSSSHRDQKLLSLFQIVSFQNDPCDVGGTRNGTCYTGIECDSRGGKSIGSCANGFGVCCTFTLECGQTTAENCTYLVQSSSSAPMSPCTYRVCPAGDDICRIRFDFTTFNINGPVTSLVENVATMEASTTIGGSLGDCTTDMFTLTSPGNFAPPLICGFNSGQHMIVDASPGRCSEAAFGLKGSGTREWDIKGMAATKTNNKNSNVLSYYSLWLVTQYSCGNEQGGPDGCLQYFTGMSGTVASFNFPTTASTLDSSATHLSSQTQTMCWRQETNTCAICWIPEILGDMMTPGSFGVSITNNRVASGITEGKCRGDYVMIPSAESNVETDAANTFIIGSIGPSIQLSNRICGRFFSSANSNDDRLASISVCSQQRPFRMTFKTDEDEITLSKMPAPASGNLNFANFNELNRIPGGIVGFNLRWTLQSCT